MDSAEKIGNEEGLTPGLRWLKRIGSSAVQL
jgi:hypothetical protein